MPESELNKKNTIQESCLNLFRIIKRLSKQFDKMQRIILKKQNITPPQLLILRQLWRNDGLPSKELSKITRTSRSTITGVVDTLEKNGFVMRELNPEDRRSWLVKLTKKGKEFQHYTPVMNIRSYYPCIEEDQIDSVIGFLDRLSNCITLPECE
ncbi:MAG: MarR family winged helix-turn-helix transcriptional regulator [Promethearchaeota archaeon]